MKEWLTSPEFLDLNLLKTSASRRSLFVFLKSVRDNHPNLVRERDSHPLIKGRHGNLVKQRGPLGHEYHYLCLPLKAIVSYENRFGPHDIGTDKAAARRGTGILATAEAGCVYAFIRRRLMISPDESVEELRRRCIEYFGEEFNAGRIVDGTQPRVPMPPIRTFQHFIRLIK